MVCHYHPERESTDNCAICGKSICKECGLEIAGKVYCKDCLEKIVGLGLNTGAKSSEPVAQETQMKTEPARLNKQPVNEAVYQPQAEPETYDSQPKAQPAPEIKQIHDDSPYNIKSNIEYAGGLESSYIQEPEPVVQEKPVIEQQVAPQRPQIAQNEYDQPTEQIAQVPNVESQEYIYPDHSYEPQPTSARRELEDKYERYLDDLYFDENEIPLEEQLAKDEEQYGSLTRRPYKPRKEEAVPQKREKKYETPEEMESRIRAEILGEQSGKSKPSDKNIHHLNYQDEKEPMNAVDIILTILLVIVILIVIYYIIYILLLSATYPTFMDAVYGLRNPQNVINGMLTH